MVKRSSRLAKRDEIEQRLASVEKALRASLAKKEAEKAAAARAGMRKTESTHITGADEKQP